MSTESLGVHIRMSCGRALERKGCCDMLLYIGRDSLSECVEKVDCTTLSAVEAIQTNSEECCELD